MKADIAAVARSANRGKKGDVAKATDKVAKAGRHGDSMLIHVSPDERAILEKVLGKPTTNPETGMPEYFGLPKWANPVSSINDKVFGPEVGGHITEIGDPGATIVRNVDLAAQHGNFGGNPYGDEATGFDYLAGGNQGGSAGSRKVGRAFGTGAALWGAGAAAGAGAGAAGDSAGLYAMGADAGLSGAELDAFVASGGTAGSTAAGGGGVGTGATGASLSDPSAPAGIEQQAVPPAQTPVVPLDASSTGATGTESSFPAGGESLQAATSPAVPSTPTGAPVGEGAELIKEPPGTPQPNQVPAKVPFSVIESLKANPLMAGALGLNVLSQVNAQRAGKSAQAQLNKNSAASRAASDRLLNEGMAGNPSAGTQAEIDKWLEGQMGQINQRYASMGRDPTRDSAAQKEIADAKARGVAMRDQAARGLLQQGFAGAGIANGPSTQAAMMGAQQDAQTQKAMSDMLMALAQIQAMQNRQPTTQSTPGLRITGGGEQAVQPLGM